MQNARLVTKRILDKMIAVPTILEIVRGCIAVINLEVVWNIVHEYRFRKAKNMKINIMFFFVA